MEYRKLLPGIFLVSMSLFMFQISLTRLFSALMWYHFVFVAVSVAIFSTGLGGILVYRIRNFTENLYGFTPDNILQRSSLFLAISLFTTTVIMYKVPFFTLASLIYLVLGSIPFILGGMFLAESFLLFPQKSMYLYFADLLGSGLASILILVLLDKYSIVTVSLYISFFALIVYFLLTPYHKKAWGIGLVLMFAVGLTSMGGAVDKAFSNFTAYSGSAKTIGLLEGNPRSVFTTWNSFARTDVIETDTALEKLILVDGSAGSKMLPFDGDLEKLSNLKTNVGYLPFALGNNSNSLVIGPGGGMDLIFSHLAGVHDITAVEINQGTIEAAREFADFNGNIYDLEGTKTFIQDGRSFIMQDTNSYDVIYLSMVMTQASEALGYALSENYIYTVEAFTEYLNRLNPGGNLGLVLHGDNDLKKAIATALKALENRGLTREEAVNSIAIVNTKPAGNHRGAFYPLLIIKEAPFTQAEAGQLLSLVNENTQELLHLPYIQPDSNLTKQNLNSWIVTDNSPFFYNSTGRSVPPLILMVFLFIYYLGKRVLRPYASVFDQSKNKAFYNYFLLLGLGFMLIEIPLLQKFILFIGHPSLTFSIVIAVLLISGGLGSLLASFFKNLSLKLPAGFVAIYTLALIYILPLAFSFWQGEIMTNKIMITALILFPLGLALGIPFPKGLMLIKEQQNSADLIPLMWGINGWMSVMGSILALMVAMVFGFNGSLVLGAAVYLLFIFNLRRIYI